MNTLATPTKLAGWKESFLWLLLAVGCFQAAYASVHIPGMGWFIVGYALGLVRLAEQPNVRRAFYFGLAAGYLAYAPQLFFMWSIFGPAAIVLWLVLAFWVGLFTALVCGSHRRWGWQKTIWLTPVIWTGLEYFRSELYYLKFSWMNIGYASPFDGTALGMYGAGFIAFGVAAVFWRRAKLRRNEIVTVIFVLGGLMVWHIWVLTASQELRTIKLAGVQMEFPSENLIPRMLDKAFGKNTNADIFVLSEYTLDGGVPESLKKWCREHQRYLVVGGKDVVTNGVYYDSAFVVGTNGEVIFKQAKSVPIQFFHDGLAATNQALWESPWGRIGICICYDLSYTRVTDRLVEQGAQMIIVPTMDIMDWGRHQHELHSRVAPVRAAEYGIPIFRVASSGISQAVTAEGKVIAQTKIGANGEIFSAQFGMPGKGVLPWDRYLAPVCVLMTGMIAGLLLLGRTKGKSETFEVNGRK